MKKENMVVRKIVDISTDVEVPTVKKLAEHARKLPDDVLAGMMATEIFRYITKEDLHELVEKLEKERKKKK